jgi:hypothetical protein
MKHIQPLLAFTLLALLASCKPYKTPIIEKVENNETVYVLPLVGNDANQVKFDSAEALEKRKVAAKEIEIDQRWIKTGRLWTSGEWRPNQRVIRVTRTAVANVYSAEGEGTHSRQNDAIWVESRDSVGFSVGWSVTAEIQEEDSSLYLYAYPASALSAVMDREIRNRIQSRCSEFAALAPMDTLRNFKAEMLTYVRTGVATVLLPDMTAEYDSKGDYPMKLQTIGDPAQGVVPFFAAKGITVTDLGIFGGFTYENKNVQAAIDKVFEAQQEKNVAAAEYDAQLKRNETIKLAAEAAAEKLRVEAQGQADANASIILAEVEALEKAQNNPLYIQRCLLEKWDGSYPRMFMGGAGESPTMLLQVPDMGDKPPVSTVSN